MSKLKITLGLLVLTLFLAPATAEFYIATAPAKWVLVNDDPNITTHLLSNTVYIDSHIYDPAQCEVECKKKFSEPVKPECGNLICEIGEDFKTCEKDCKELCGNGKCDDKENATCPKDCNIAEEEWKKCLTACTDGKLPICEEAKGLIASETCDYKSSLSLTGKESQLVRVGFGSDVYSYEGEKQFLYEPGWAQTSISLKIDLNGSWGFINNISYHNLTREVSNLTDTWNETIGYKFGAYDPYCTGNCTYLYNLTSDHDWKVEGNKAYISHVVSTTPLVYTTLTVEDRHYIDFGDLRSINSTNGTNVTWINPIFNVSGGNLTVRFTSNGTIDPNLTQSYVGTFSGWPWITRTEVSNLGVRLHAPVLDMQFDSDLENKGTAITYVKDDSLYNNYGTCDNTSGYCPTWNPTGGHDGRGAYEFVADYIALSNSSSWDFGKNNFALSVWIYPNYFVPYSGIVSIARLQPIKGWSVYTTGDGVVRMTSDGGATNIITSNSTALSANNWNHIMIIRNGTGSDNLMMFINGTRVSTADGDVDLSDDNNEGLVIGKFYLNMDSHYLFGSIDDVQIFDRALSADEILNLYNGTYNGSAEIGTYARNGNFTSFVFQNDTSTFWNTTLSIADSSGQWNTKDLCDADSNCVSYWPLDGNYSDVKGSNDGTPTGTNNATGISSGAMRFDGTNDIIDFGDSASINSTLKGDFAFSGWFRTTSTATQMMLFKRTVAALQPGLQMYVDTSNGLFYGYLDFGATAKAVNSVVSVRDGYWHHVAFVRSGTTLNLYVDGVLKGTDTTAGNDADVSNSEKFIMGARNPATWAGVEAYFNGQMDEVQAYNKSLSALEVLTLYKAGLSQHANASVTLYTRTADNYNLTDEGLVSFYPLNGNMSDLKGGNDGTCNPSIGSCVDNGTTCDSYDADGTNCELANCDYSADCADNGGCDAYDGDLDTCVSGAVNCAETGGCADDGSICAANAGDLDACTTTYSCAESGGCADDTTTCEAHNDDKEDCEGYSCAFTGGCYDNGYCLTAEHYDLCANAECDASGFSCTGTGFCDGLSEFDCVPAGCSWATACYANCVNPPPNCESIVGCAETGSCAQGATSCDSMTNEGECEAVGHCSWSGDCADDTNCIPLRTSAGCTAESHCSWTGGCSDNGACTPLRTSAGCTGYGHCLWTGDCSDNGGCPSQSWVDCPSYGHCTLVNGDCADDGGCSAYSEDESGCNSYGHCSYSTTSGCPESTDDGVVGGAYEFDGAEDYIIVPDDPSLNFDANDFTLSAWVKTTPTASPYSDLFSKVEASAYGYQVSLGSSGVYVWSTSTNGNFGASEYRDGQWHHIVTVFSGGDNAKVYADNALLDSKSFTYDGDSSVNLCIGTFCVDNVSMSQFANGSIDEVRIYNRSLSAEEIQSLYELGSAHITDWTAWQEEGVITDGIPETNAVSSKFFQFKTEMQTDNTSVSPYLINHTIAYSLTGDGDLISPILDWNWTDINTIIYVNYTNICVNGSEMLDNCTFNFNGTAYDNLTDGTNLCYNVTPLVDGNYITINATCYDMFGNSNITSNSWLYYDSCVPNMTNTTWSEWQNQSLCLINDTQLQNRSLTEYDNNSCGEVANITYWEYNYTECNYCSYDVVNTSWSDWQNMTSCLVNDTYEQNRSMTEYDANYSTCYAITNISTDLWNNGSNNTYWEYQWSVCDFCTPNMTNTSWSDWQNDGLCLINDTQLQNRSLTEYDQNYCGEVSNTTYWDYQYIACDFCTPNLVNTSYGSWTNYTSCLVNDTYEQVQNLTQYDENYCGEVANETFYNYQWLSCDFCTPNLTNTSWSDWQNTSECIAGNISQERNLTQYDSNYCGEVANETYYEYQNINCTTTELILDCPSAAFVNEMFNLSADYRQSNGTDILGANVTITDGTGWSSWWDYDYTIGAYAASYFSADVTNWCVTINASLAGYETMTDSCCVLIAQAIPLTIKLWEQVELKFNATTNITSENYDKLLEDPYINDFGYIIARSNNNDSDPGYEYCNLPFASGQNLMKIIKTISLLNKTTLDNLTLPLKQYVGCDQRWYRADYRAGEADLSLLEPGNYSLYFLDGVMKWDGSYSPPEITKSNMFMWIGDIVIPDRVGGEMNFWVSHDELDFWASWTDSLFLFMTTIVPILIFLALIFLGIPMPIAGMIALSYETLWMLISFL